MAISPKSQWRLNSFWRGNWSPNDFSVLSAAVLHLMLNDPSQISQPSLLLKWIKLAFLKDHWEVFGPREFFKRSLPLVTIERFFWMELKILKRLTTEEITRRSLWNHGDRWMLIERSLRGLAIFFNYYRSLRDCHLCEKGFKLIIVRITSELPELLWVLIRIAYSAMRIIPLNCLSCFGYTSELPQLLWE